MTRAITKTTSYKSVTLPANREDLYINTIDHAVTFLSKLSNKLQQPFAGVFCFAVSNGCDDDHKDIYSVFNFGSSAAIYRETNDHHEGWVGRFMTKKEYSEWINLFLMD